MRLLDFGVRLVSVNQNALQNIERAYRVCYQSDSEGGDSANFVRSKMAMGHLSPLEHESITMEFTVDRGVTHELVRHRIAAYAQESTRFCNYERGRFGGGISVIKPSFFDPDAEKIPTLIPTMCVENGHVSLIEDPAYFTYMSPFDVWFLTCLWCEWGYLTLIRMGRSPQEARTVLPNSTKTSILVTYNLREWRHVFELRSLGTTGKPHPQMKEVMDKALIIASSAVPAVFDDLYDALRGLDK